MYVTTPSGCLRLPDGVGGEAELEEAPFAEQALAVGRGEPLAVGGAREERVEATAASATVVGSSKRAVARGQEAARSRASVQKRSRPRSSSSPRS